MKPTAKKPAAKKPAAGQPDRQPEKTPADPHEVRLLFIDVIEGDVARLVERGGPHGVITRTLPVDLLPRGAGEGSWIEWRLRVVPPPPGEDPASLRRKLGQGDPGGDLVL